MGDTIYVIPFSKIKPQNQW